MATGKGGAIWTERHAQYLVGVAVQAGHRPSILNIPYPNAIPAEAGQPHAVRAPGNCSGPGHVAMPRGARLSCLGIPDPHERITAAGECHPIRAERHTPDLIVGAKQRVLNCSRLHIPYPERLIEAT